MGTADKLFNLAEAVVGGLEQIGNALPPRARAPSRYEGKGPSANRPEDTDDRFDRGTYGAPSTEVRPAVQDQGGQRGRRGQRGHVYQIIEAIEDDGTQIWVVTNGTDRAVCNSSKLAERVRVALGR